MERISSSQTFFVKRIFPALWFGFLVVFLAIGATQGDFRREPMLVIQPLVMVAIGALVFRKFLWDLADEVRDAGENLIVRKGGIEERVALSNVMNVDSSQFSNPRRVTLRLRKPGRLGGEIVFVPKSSFQLNPFARNPVAEMLIQRIDRLRQAG
jgi:hypothetical protein